MGDFPGDQVVGNLPASAGDTGSTPGPGRFQRSRATKPVYATTTEAAL